MAGSGYKLFATGDVLTAAQVNNYLQEQTVMVFASAAARTTALSTVLAEGMISYLKDTKATEFYNGTAWTALGGTASPLTTKGDLYGYSTTNARVAVGTNGQILTADSTASTGLAWAAASASGLTLVKTQTIGTTVTSVTVTGAFSNTYDNYRIIVSGGVLSSVGNMGIQLGSTTTGYFQAGFWQNPTANTVNGDAGNNISSFQYCAAGSTSGCNGLIDLLGPNLAKPTAIVFSSMRPLTPLVFSSYRGVEGSSTQHTAFTMAVDQGTATGGTIKVYGYANS